MTEITKIAPVRYFTSRDVAAACGADLKAVHLWAEDPQKALPHFLTPGGHLRFKARKIGPWLRKHGYDVPAAILAEERREGTDPFALAVAALAAANLRDPLGRQFAALCAEHGVGQWGSCARCGERDPSCKGGPCRGVPGSEHDWKDGGA